MQQQPQPQVPQNPNQYQKRPSNQDDQLNRQLDKDEIIYPNNNGQMNTGQQFLSQVGGVKKQSECDPVSMSKLMKLLDGKYKLAKKLNESGFGYNDRIVTIQNGELRYFVKPSNFEQTQTLPSTAEPKQSIKLSAIRFIEMPVSDDHIKDLKGFKVFFPKDALGVQDKQGGVSKEMMWQFLMTNFLQEIQDGSDIDFNIISDKQREEYEKKRQEEELQRKKMEDIEQSKHRIIQQEQAQKLAQEEQLRKQQELELKQKEEELRKQKEQEDKQLREKQAKLQNAWEFRYHQLWDEAIKNQNIFEPNLKTGINLYRLIGDFRLRCQETAKVLIEQLYYPEIIQKYQQLGPNQQQIKFKEKKEYAYLLNNIIVRIARIESVEDNVQDIRTQQKLQDQITQNYLKKDFYQNYFKDYETNPISKNSLKYYQVYQSEVNIYNNFNTKLICNEFKSFDALSDVLFILRRDQEFKFKVPLVCQVDYSGFTALCIADLPLKDYDSMVVGPTNEGQYNYQEKLQMQLNLLSDALNLKPFPFLFKDSGKIMVYLSILTEFHSCKDFVWEDIRNILMNEDQKDIQDMQNKRKQRGQKKKNQKEVEPDFYYILRVGHLMPLDIDVQSPQKQVLFSRRLRPEFIFNNLDENCPALSNGAFINNLPIKDIEMDDIEVASAGLKLRKSCIPQLAKQLDKLELMPVDSYSMSQTFHNKGINMRYLGLVCSLSVIPHVKSICLVEMCARTTKKIFRTTLSDFILYNFQKDNPSIYAQIKQQQLNDKQNSYNNINLSNVSVTDHKDGLRQTIKNKMEADIKINTLDLLNLIFGNSKDSEKYWTKILRNQIMLDFNYDIGQIFPVPLIQPGALLHAISYHWRLQLKFDYTIKSKLFKEEAPFTADNIGDFIAATKVYSYKTLDLSLLSYKFKEYRKNQEFDLALKSLNIRIGIELALKHFGQIPPGPQPEAIYLAEMAEVYMEMNNQSDIKDEFLQKAIDKANQALKIIPLFHALAVKPLSVLINANYHRNKSQDALNNFQNVLEIIEFHWGVEHPLNASIYSIMGKLYQRWKMYRDAQQLFESSLVTCVKNLGSNHIQTAQVYLDISQLCYTQKERDLAISYIEKSLSIMEAEYGQDSIECGKLSQQIGELFIKQGKYVQAYPYNERAYKIYLHDEVSNNEKIVQTGVNCCLGSIGCQKFDMTLKYVDVIWRVLEEYEVKSPKTINYFDMAFRSALHCYMEALSQDQKKFFQQLLIYFKYFNQELKMTTRNPPSINQTIYDQQQLASQQLQSQLQPQQNNSILMSNSPYSKEPKSILKTKSPDKMDLYNNTNMANIFIQQGISTSPDSSPGKKKRLRFDIQEKKTEDEYTQPTKDQQLQNSISNYLRDLCRQYHTIIGYVKYFIYTILQKQGYFVGQEFFHLALQDLIIYLQEKSQLKDEKDTFVEQLMVYEKILILFGETYFNQVLRSTYNDYNKQYQLNNLE